MHPVSQAHSLLAAWHPHGDVSGAHCSGSCPVCLVSASDQQSTPAMLPVQVSCTASPASRAVPPTPGTPGSVDFSGMTPSVASRGRAALAHQCAQEVRPPAAQHNLGCTACLNGRSATFCRCCSINAVHGLHCQSPEPACPKLRMLLLICNSGASPALTAEVLLQPRPKRSRYIAAGTSGGLVPGSLR